MYGYSLFSMDFVKSLMKSVRVYYFRNLGDDNLVVLVLGIRKDLINLLYLFGKY